MYADFFNLRGKISSFIIFFIKDVIYILVAFGR
jgi:hypothetical protein